MKLIVVEGPIGVGKTTLTRKLARTFGYELLLEGAAENPFLERFYGDQKQWALQTQLFFLLSGMVMFLDLMDDDEFRLYDKVYQHVITNIPRPDLVIYLQASVETLQQRITRRAIPCEQDITDDYLSRLSEAYVDFFLRYDESPLLMVNTEHLNLAESTRDYENPVAS